MTKRHAVFLVGLCSLVVSHARASVSWVGGSGDWNTPTNWSTGKLPGANDDVLIDSPGINIVVTIASGAIKVKGLQSEEALVIKAGSLTITGISAIGGALTMNPGTVLTANGPGAAVSVSGASTVVGAGFFATSGGTMALPGLKIYTGPNTIRADGAGSRVDLSGLTSLVGTTQFYQTSVEALNGGEVNLAGEIKGGVKITINGVSSRMTFGRVSKLSGVDLFAQAGGILSLPGVTNFTGPNTIRADGAGSRVDLSGLTSLVGTTQYYQTSVEALNGGEVNLAGEIKSGVKITINGASSRMTFAGVSKLSGVDLFVQTGVVLSLPAVSALTNVSLFAQAGGILSLPGVTNFTGPNTIRADGAGSRVDLSGLTSLVGTTQYYQTSVEALNGGEVNLAGEIKSGVKITINGASSRMTFAGVSKLSGVDLFVQTGVVLSLPAVSALTNVSLFAQAGGILSLPGVTNFTGPNTIRADGAGSRVDLPGLTSLVGTTQYYQSSVEALNGGEVNLAGEIKSGVKIIINGASSRMTFAGVSKLSGVDLFAQAGGILSLPGVTNFTGPNTIRADGAGSIVDLPGLTSLVGSTGLYQTSVEALNGGQALLTNLTTIPDSIVSVLADGTNSVVDLSGLNAYQGTKFAFALEARNGGSILVPNLVSLQRANFIVRNAGSISTSKLRTLRLSTVTIDGTTASFPALIDTTGTTFIYKNDGRVTPLPPNTAPLLLNQLYTSRLPTAFASDAWIFSAVAGQQVQFDLVNISRSGVLFDLAGPAGWIGFTSQTNDFGPVTLATSGAYTLTASGAGFPADYAIRVWDLTPSDLAMGAVYNGQFVGSGQAQVFRVVVTNSNPMRIVLSNPGTGNRNELHVKFGAPPTRGDFDYGFTSAGPNQQVLVPNASPGTWYALVYGETITTPSDYTLQTTSAGMFLTSISPTRYANDATLTMTLAGAGFDASSSVSLMAANGAAFPAPSVTVNSFVQLTATFLSNTVPLGRYSVLLSQPDGDVAELTNVFEMVTNVEPQLETRLIVPSRLGYHVPATIYVEQQNSGNVTAPGSMLVLRALQNDHEGAFLTTQRNRVVAGFWTSVKPEGFDYSTVYLTGAIPPGGLFRAPAYYAGWQKPWDFSYPPINFSAMNFTVDNPTPVDWSALMNAMKPDAVDAETWGALWPNFVSQIGTTWGDYVRMLNDNAAYLARLGIQVIDVSQLLGFELLQANGLNPVSVLASAVDASVPAPGLPLVFRRSFATPITSRYRLGPLGRGWSHNWQYTLEQSADGKATLVGPSGSRRVFQPDSRHPGAYFPQPGDHGTLTSLAKGVITLRETSGLLRVFRSDGSLDYLRDLNGNRITAGYTGTLLTSLTHSSGQRLQFAYSGNRMQSATDQFGRQTQYNYDGASEHEHLTGVVYYDGRTASYTYGSGASRHALTQVVNSCCTRRYFTYDALGRLDSTYREGNVETITFAYDTAGKVTSTDALGNSTQFYFDHSGLIVKTEDALANTVRRAFDENFNLVSLTDPAGHESRYGYDDNGNLIRFVDAAGHTTSFAYDASLNRLTSLTDANANTTQYAYSTNGNLRSITYADNSVERWTYDPFGNATAWTNRRQHPINYTHNTSGQLTSKLFADGSRALYDYDARGNLTNAVTRNPQNAILESAAMRYDVNDQLTNVTYTGGQFLAFTYDSDGRRASSVDQLGHRLEYQYDAAGRLESMTNELGSAIVRYQYDAAGRLDRKTLGNAVFTTYRYDVAGHLLNLTNRGSDNSVLSFFNYAYDSRGRRTAMNTHSGNWTYEYDDLSQLTQAVLVSTDTSIPNQDLTYVYDALGNRIRTIENGATAEYTANSLNQYVRVGSTNYVFDADGNLIKEITPQGTNTFTYSDENRLVALTNQQGSWNYSYDALGERVVVTEGGVAKRLVIDPVGLGNLVGEYEAGGNLVAHNDHDFGLLSRTDSVGNPTFYAFDAIGNSCQLITGSSVAANAYIYSPFGTKLGETEAVPNPFQFVGQFGVMNEGNGLSFMRTRFYSGGLGRFFSPDLIGLTGGDVNLQRYVWNNPLSLNDPSGQVSIFPWLKANIFPWLDNPLLHVWGHNIYFLWHDYYPEVRNLYQQLGDAINNAVNAIGGGSGGDGNGNNGISGVKPPQTPDTSCTQSPQLCKLIATTAPQDPNGKLGPMGFGSQGFISLEGPLAYRVDFENDQKAAVPAQQVVITDQVNGNLNWPTFQWTELGFGDQLIALPPSLQHFETNVPISYLGTNFEVQIELDFHAASGQASASFRSVDPRTSLPPPVNIGFLPPEDGTGRGQGHIGYLIGAKAGLPTGTQIRNIASISFDGLPAIATNQRDPHDASKGTDPDKEALNTIDTDPPGSSVTSLEANMADGTFLVSWSGTDAGSGVTGYDVYVSTDEGPWTLWLSSTGDTSALFQGANGRTYAFYSVARDNVGLVEPPPQTPDALTAVIAKPQLSIVRANSQIVVTWPQEANGFQLESSDTLFPLANWVPVPNTPVVVGDQKTVTLDILGETKFYRLRKP